MASGVDMVLLMRVLSVVISAVVVATSPGKSIRFPPTLSLVLCVSDFYGLISQTIFPYVTFQSCGTYDFGMKKIVFDTTTLLTTPCTSMSNLF